MKMAMMKIMLKVFNTYFPLHWEFFSSSTMLIFSSNMASSHYGCFLPKKHPFSDPPGPGITPGWGIKVLNTSFSIAWGVF